MFGEKILTIIDIGTSEIRACVVIVDIDQVPKIKCVETVPSAGIKHGGIVDLEKVQDKILDIIRKIESKSGVQIKEVMISLSNVMARSKWISKSGYTSSKRVSQEDVDRILAKIYDSIIDTNNKILTKVPFQYNLDDSTAKNPIGLYSEHLTVDLHAVLVPFSKIQEVNDCFVKNNVDIFDFGIPSMVVGEISLSKSDKEIGTCIIDIGHSSTSVSVFYDGNFVHTSHVALGGENITKDIMEIVCVSRDEAERIKIKYGELMASNSLNQKIEINVEMGIYGEKGLQDDFIAKEVVDNIISKRVEEILIKVKKSLGDMESVVKRYVLTGGVAATKNIDVFCGKVLKKNTKLSIKPKILGFGFDADDIRYDVITCLALYGVELLNKRTGSNKISQIKYSGNVIKRIISWIKDEW